MRVTILCAVIALVVCSSLCAQIPALTTTVVGNSGNGLSAPVYCCSPPGDLNRLFVVQKGGLIKVRTPTNAAGVWTTCLNVSSLVSTGSEQGLLGMAFHPNFATNGYFFIFYTSTPSPGNEVVRRYTIPAGSDIADPTSGLTFLTVADPESNHNGGSIHFGPDGYLYIGIGDGGGGNDQHGTCGNAQNTSVLLGKLLRINVDVPNGPIPYSIPPGNPFAANATGKEIFHYGLRNPFRWCFDRLTGDLWIGDVGQNAVEEVDFLPAGTAGGQNFGWRCKEGNNNTGLSGPPNCTCPSNPTAPVYTYANSPGYACIGGYPYRGCAIPQLRGHYFFADYGAGQVWSINYTGTAIPAGTATPRFTLSSVAGFGEDGYGELYICQIGSQNSIRKIVPTVPQLVGVVSYGTGTAGCTGTSVLSMFCSPTNLNPGEAFNSTHGPPSGTGILVVSGTQLPVGSDPFNAGVETLLDVNAPLLPLQYFTVGASGTTSFPLPIPYVPFLVGFTFYAQEFFYWTTCTPTIFNYSSTQALAITIQP